MCRVGLDSSNLNDNTQDIHNPFQTEKISVSTLTGEANETGKSRQNGQAYRYVNQDIQR